MKSPAVLLMMDRLSKQLWSHATTVDRSVQAILDNMPITNSYDQVMLDKTYTIATVLQTTNLNNVAIELTGTINLSPGVSILSLMEELYI